MSDGVCGFDGRRGNRCLGLMCPVAEHRAISAEILAAEADIAEVDEAEIEQAMREMGE